MAVNCPKCNAKSQQGILETRRDDTTVYRRRYCSSCGVTHWTQEQTYIGVVPQSARRPAKPEPTARAPRKSPWDILMEKRK